MNKRIIITIDGWSSCGKSTLARQLARELGYVYIDSGAMYRAITLYFLRNHVDWTHPDAVHEALPLSERHPWLWGFGETLVGTGYKAGIADDRIVPCTETP